MQPDSIPGLLERFGLRLGEPLDRAVQGPSHPAM
jgi:hypothetical protein